MKKVGPSIGALGAVVLSALLLTGCDRFGGSPIQWLTLIIPVLAILVFILQYVKNW